MIADGLAMQGANASSAMILIYFSSNIPVSASEGLTLQVLKALKILPRMQHNLQNIISNHQWLKNTWGEPVCAVNTVSADGLAPLGARPSAGLVMTKTSPCVCKKLSLEVSNIYILVNLTKAHFFWSHCKKFCSISFSLWHRGFNPCHISPVHNIPNSWFF